jgi:hypothetical protein
VNAYGVAKSQDGEIVLGCPMGGVPNIRKKTETRNTAIGVPYAIGLSN